MKKKKPPCFFINIHSFLENLATGLLFSLVVLYVIPLSPLFPFMLHFIAIDQQIKNAGLAEPLYA